MREKLIQSIMNVKGCDRHEAIRMLLVAASEWDAKVLRMGSHRRIQKKQAVTSPCTGAAL